MSLENILNRKTLFIIFFMMLFIYTAEGIVFRDEISVNATQILSKPSFSYMPMDDLPDFSAFVNYNFQCVVETRKNGSSELLERTGGIYLDTFVSAWIDDYTDLYDYNTGMEWLSKHGEERPLWTYYTKSLWSCVYDRYTFFLQNHGWQMTPTGITPYQESWATQLQNALLKIPEMMMLFFRITTFSLDGHYGDTVLAPEVTVILNMIVLPLYCILFLGLLPWILRTANTLIKFIEAIIPF